MLPNAFDINVLYGICFLVLAVKYFFLSPLSLPLSFFISLHPRLQRRSRWTWKARSSPMESWTVWAQPAPATWTTTAACRAWPATRATPPAVSNLPSPPRPPTPPPPPPCPSLPNPPALPSVYPSGHAYVRIPSHLRRRPRPPANSSFLLSSAPSCS